MIFAQMTMKPSINMKATTNLKKQRNQILMIILPLYYTKNQANNKMPEYLIRVAKGVSTTVIILKIKYIKESQNQMVLKQGL